MQEKDQELEEVHIKTKFLNFFTISNESQE